MFALAWSAVISLPAAAIASRLIFGLEPLAWLATLALILAWWLAGRRVSGLVAATLLTLCGLAADLIWGVRVVRIMPLAGQLLRWLAAQLGERDVPAPAVTYFQEQGAALASFGQRLAWWTSGLVGGQGTPDNLVVIGLAGLAAWALAAWAGWWVARRGQPFLALLPTGSVLAVVAYWAEDVRWTLLLLLASTTLLLVLGRLVWSMAGWEREGVDYSPEIRLDVALTGLALAFLVSILAPTLPFLTSRQVSQAFWRLFESPYREVEERVSSSFAAVQPARSFVPPAGIAVGGLPRAHLLGGRPELGQEIALRVRVRGAAPTETLYWRGQTFAYYTGSGWDESAAQVSELRLAVGQPWNTGSLVVTGRPLVNSVEVVAGSWAVLYAAGEPVAADRPYRGPTARARRAHRAVGRRCAGALRHPLPGRRRRFHAVAAGRRGLSFRSHLALPPVAGRPGSASGRVGCSMDRRRGSSLRSGGGHRVGAAPAALYAGRAHAARRPGGSLLVLVRPGPGLLRLFRFGHGRAGAAERHPGASGSGLRRGRV